MLKTGWKGKKIRGFTNKLGDARQSDLCRENWAFLGNYAGGYGISYRRFGEHLSGSTFKVQTLEDGINR
jgi:hypothetical protein